MYAYVEAVTVKTFEIVVVADVAEDFVEGTEVSDVFAVALGEVLGDSLKKEFEDSFGFFVVQDELDLKFSGVGLVVHSFWSRRSLA